MKDLHVLPKFADRWSHLYLEHGRLSRPLVQIDRMTFVCMPDKTAPKTSRPPDASAP